MHPPDRQLELFFPVVIMIAHPPDRRLYLFFPVVIMVAHSPDRRLELFFSGRNNDRALARQTTRTFFSGRNNDHAPARQTTRTFYFPPEPKKLTQHHNCMVLQVHISMYDQNLFPARTKNWQLEKRFLQTTRSVGRFLQPTRSECISMWRKGLCDRSTRY